MSSRTSRDDVAERADRDPDDTTITSRDRADLYARAAWLRQTQPDAWVRALSELLTELTAAKELHPFLTNPNGDLMLLSAVRRADVIAGVRSSTEVNRRKTLTNPDLSGLNRDGKDAGKKVSQKFEYPEPDKEAKLEALKEQIGRLADIAHITTSLGLEGSDARLMISGLHELSGESEALARTIGMHAVSAGHITQRELAHDLEVHEVTVSRWVKEARTHTENPPQPSGQ